MSELLLEAKKISVFYQPTCGILPSTATALQALEEVTVSVGTGEALALVGESGSGKTTLAKVVAGLLKPSVGEVFYEGQKHDFLGYQPWVQMVFQNPYGSLNPRLDVQSLVAEGLQVRKIGDNAARRRKVLETLDVVGLSRNMLGRYPHQLSGGQQQRVALARALAVSPRLLVLDEPLAALDVSAQAHLLLLLAELKTQFNLSYLFITHNLAAVRQFCERIAVMYLGRIVENGPVSTVLSDPGHQYTAMLLEAYLWPDPARKKRTSSFWGEIPDPFAVPDGCRFHPRCSRASSRCRKVPPLLLASGPERFVACHLPVTNAGR
ncbi:MAG: ABC transporter ATP-binding protein [Firmicutes bacterium]|nr:ABC transporter ATP-binding protein [Bacillota bacterium]